MFWKTPSLKELKITELIYPDHDESQEEEPGNISLKCMRKVIKLLTQKKYFPELELLSFCGVGGEETNWRKYFSSDEWEVVVAEGEY